MAKSISNPLLEALRFVHLAQSGRGVEPATHCMIRYGQIIVADRMLAAGCAIKEDDLHCCPQTDRLILAFERCGAEYSLTQQDTDLSVRSGDFAAFVPVCDPAKLATVIPDPPQAPLGDEFKAALKVAGLLVKENAPTVIQSAIQLLPYSCCSTNGNVIVEAWHGYDMPPGLVIPKAFAEAVYRSKRKIVNFGFSDKSLTVHFEGGAWLRTLIYDAIPDIVGKLFEVAKPIAFEPEFFKKADAVAKWSEDNKVYIHDFCICSHPHESMRVGASLAYPVADMRQQVSYSIASLKLISKIATHFEDRTKDGVTMFFGKKLRGAIAHEQELPF